jgi:hypothetical protein
MQAGHGNSKLDTKNETNLAGIPTGYGYTAKLKKYSSTYI